MISHNRMLRGGIASACKRMYCKAAGIAAAAALTFALAIPAAAQTTPTVTITPGDVVTLKYKSVPDQYNSSQTNIVGSLSQLSAKLTADGEDVTDQYTIAYTISGTGASLNNGLLTATGEGTSTVTMTATPKDAAAYSAVTREITVNSSEIGSSKLVLSLELPKKSQLGYSNSDNCVALLKPTVKDNYGNVVPAECHDWTGYTDSYGIALNYSATENRDLINTFVYGLDPSIQTYGTAKDTGTIKVMISAIPGYYSKEIYDFTNKDIVLGSRYYSWTENKNVCAEVVYPLVITARVPKTIITPDPSTITLKAGDYLDYENRWEVSTVWIDESDDNIKNGQYIDDSDSLIYSGDLKEAQDKGITYAYSRNGKAVTSTFSYELIIPTEYLEGDDPAIKFVNPVSSRDITFTDSDGKEITAKAYTYTKDWGSDPTWELIFNHAGKYNIFYQINPDDKNRFAQGKPHTYVVNVDELTLDETNWNDHLTFEHLQKKGGTVDVTTIRTLVAGDDKYNTYCLPFDVDRATLDEKLGEGYELMQLSEAEFEGSKLTLNFTTTSDGITAGMPYLISKIKETVVNPAYANALIKLPTADADSTFTIPYDGGTITFYGTAFPTEIPNNDRNVIFTTASGVLKYTAAKSNIHHGNATTKGQRGYFIIHPADASAAKPALAMAFRKPDVTEVKSVEYRVNGKKVPAYNIEGQRVGEGYRGIVIRGGKKYLQK